MVNEDTADKRVLVGTVDGLWDAGTRECVHFKGREVRSLATDNSGYLAIIDSREVCQFDRGGGWTQIGSVESSKAHCLCSTHDGLLVGASEASLFLLRDQTLDPVRSFDSAPGRDEWYTPWGGPPDVRSMAADSSGTVYVNVHVGGIVRSTDGGKRWQPTIHVHADVHQVLHHAGSDTLLAATGVWGLASSPDSGESWQPHTEGLHGTYLRAVAVAGETILVTASTGPSTQRSAVYRTSVNGAEPFERCQRGLPEWFSHNIDTFCLAALDFRVAFATSDGQVFLSSDEGRSWHVIGENLPSILCVGFG